MVEVSQMQLWLTVVVATATGLAGWLSRHELTLGRIKDRLQKIEQRVIGHSEDDKDSGLSGDLHRVESELGHTREDVSHIRSQVDEVADAQKQTGRTLSQVLEIVSEDSDREIFVADGYGPTDDD